MAVIITSKTFTKKERLLRPEEFTKIKTHGKRRSTRSFNIWLMPNNLTASRLGLAVSARVGGAIIRNRLKRYIREFFRLNKGRISNPTDIMISVKSAQAVTDYSAAAAELESVLIQAPRISCNQERT
ncbi:MAG: ribonuclease P protein component [Deltaproteobacteria bacterium]|nr:ribonuclease P protein component [Deltaproteobacteria bacterium]